MTSIPESPQWMGITLNDVIKYFLVAMGGLIFGLISAGIVGWWSGREPHIRYSTSEPIQFSGEKLKVAIATVFITNDGNKEAEELQCSLRLEHTRIQEVKVSPWFFKPSITINGDGFNVKQPLLNPGQSMQVSALAYTDDKPIQNPAISVSAKGIEGEAQSQTYTPVRGSGDVFAAGVFLGMLSIGMIVTCFVFLIVGWNDRRFRNQSNQPGS